MKKILLIFFVLICCNCFFSINYKSFAENDLQIIKLTDENREQVLSTHISEDETYAVKDRKYQAGPVVAVTGNRIWATWMTGGLNEPDKNNYAVVAYSDDKGENWVDPFIIIDKIGVSEYSPVVWADDLGRLWIFWNYGGVNAIIIEHPEDTPEKIKLDYKGILMPNNLSGTTPLILSDGTYLAPVESGYFKGSTHYYESKNKGQTWNMIGETQTSALNAKLWEEGTIVELSDGKLWALIRLDKGNSYESFYSTDKGHTWSKGNFNTEDPIRGPGSRVCLKKLSSGSLVFVTNNSSTARTDLTAYISKDDGKTWSNGLLIDDSYLCEYPICTEDSEQNIYVIWARGRTKEAEIRMAVLNEEVIQKGEMGNCKTMILVSRGSDFKDITEIQNLEKTIKVKKGTSFDEVIKMLPETIQIKDDNLEVNDVKIRYICSLYDANKDGNYKVTVKLDETDNKYQDVHHLLYLNVIVGNDKEGCYNAININNCIAIMLFITLFISKKIDKNFLKKRENYEK